MARAIIIKALRRDLSLNRTGAVFGINHSTVIHALKRDDKYKENFDYRRVSVIVKRYVKTKDINLQIEFYQDKIDKLKKLI
jgi:hypothetical protein